MVDFKSFIGVVEIRDMRQRLDQVRFKPVLIVSEAELALDVESPGENLIFLGNCETMVISGE